MQLICANPRSYNRLLLGHQSYDLVDLVDWAALTRWPLNAPCSGTSVILENVFQMEYSFLMQISIALLGAML